MLTTNYSNAQSIKDIDGNVYKTVVIGTQTWMAENLKVTKYRNGDLIGTTSPATKKISDEKTPKYQWTSEGGDSNVATYGRLYTWYVVTDERNLCPIGWHVPSDIEWLKLIEYLGGDSVAGSKLQSTRTEPESHPRWESKNNPKANNESNFSGLPGGLRDGSDTFKLLGYYSFWWSSKEWSQFRDIKMAYSNSNNAWHYILNFEGISEDHGNKCFGEAVRCIKD